MTDQIRAAFRAGFMAHLVAPDPTETDPLKILDESGRWRFDGNVTAGDKEPAAFAAWSATLDAPAPETAPARCVWTRRINHEADWMTGCGFEFVAGFSCTPEEDEMRWCGYCGRPIEVQG